jgi:hypothetical protein
MASNDMPCVSLLNEYNVGCVLKESKLRKGFVEMRKRVPRSVFRVPCSVFRVPCSVLREQQWRRWRVAHLGAEREVGRVSDKKLLENYS